MTSPNKTDSQHKNTKDLLKELELSRQLLEETERTGNIGGWEFDVKTLTQKWTKQTFRILEIDTTHGAPEVPQGVGYIDPPYRDMANRAIQKAIEFGEPYDQEWEITTFKGNKRWVHAVGRVRKQNGTVVGVYGSFQDITQSKKAEEALERQAKLIDLSPDGIMVRKVDGTITFWSKGAEKLYGWTKAEAIGKSTHELFETKYTEPFEKIMAKLERSKSWTGELVHKTKSGKEVIVQSWWLAESEKKGAITQLLETNVDITERKKAEEILRESEELYRTIFENSEDGFQLVKPIFDENGEPIDYLFLQVNQAYERQVGLRAEQVVGKTVREIVPNIEPEWIETHGQVAKTGKSLHREIYNEFSKRWYDLYYFKYKEGQVGVLFRDITARKELEKSLQENEKLATIGQTAGMVGHDIRNPLQAIVSELFLAKEAISKATDSDCKQEVTESLEFIEDQVDYINKIVADLQDYARSTRPSITDVNIKDLVENAFSAISVPGSIEAVCDVEPNLRIRSDPSYLRRMITNLCNNAIQAMPNGGKLTLTIKTKSKFLEMTVGDTGEGIPEELKEKMFKPLFTTKAKGQGFGLAVVKKFTEQLGGTITFYSQVGRGTTFKIQLPLAQEQD